MRVLAFDDKLQLFGINGITEIETPPKQMNMLKPAPYALARTNAHVSLQSNIKEEPKVEVA